MRYQCLAVARLQNRHHRRRQISAETSNRKVTHHFVKTGQNSWKLGPSFNPSLRAQSMKSYQRQDLGLSRPGYTRVIVWDVPTRLFHWGTVLLVSASLFTARFNLLAWHACFGRVLLALVVFRLIWGLVGSDTSRFQNFLTWPWPTMFHLSSETRQEARFPVGHSPHGGWMILYLLVLLLAQTLGGLYIYNDVAKVGLLFGKFPQTLVDAIIRLHVIGSQILVLSIALHVLVVSFYLVVKKRNLISAMISGRQLVPLSTPCPQRRSHSLAIYVALLSMCIVYLLSRL
jgi:cytochrome b